MRFLTDFGDQAFILPLTLVVALVLSIGGWRRGAAAWVVSVAATLTAVLLGKLVVFACHPLSLTGLQSPSGHTASAAVAFGGLLALLAPRGWRIPLLAVTGAVVAAALVGTSRVALKAHSIADVLAGAMLGIAGALLLVRLAGDRPARLRRAPSVAAALATVILFHGAHLGAERNIAWMSHMVWPLTLCRAPGLRP